MAAKLPVLDRLISALQQCRQEKNLAQAKRLLAYMRQHRLDTHTILGNYLVPLLVECGSLPDAQHVFDRHCYPNEYSWCAILSGYINSGNPQQALVLYGKMWDKAVPLNSHMHVALLKACAMLKDANRGQMLHSEIVKHGLLEADLHIGNVLVHMYSRCGLLAETRLVFDNLHPRDVVSWNSLIAGLIDHELNEEALNYLDQMQLQGVPPAEVTYLCGLKACSNTGAADRGYLLCADIVSKGMKIGLFLGSAMVDMYAKCGCLAEAQQVFEKLPHRNVVSWNALIGGFSEHGFGEKALSFIQQMLLEDVSPDNLTLVCCLKACCSIQSRERGQELHSDITKRGLERELTLATTLVDMYAKCSSLEEAQAVFDTLAVQDAISWAALISGYAENGFADVVVDCLKQMQLEGISLLAETFAYSLKACAISRAFTTGQQIYTEVIKRGLERELHIGTSLVDMYAKCGLLSEADEVFKTLPVQDAVAWAALISGYSEKGLGNEALDCLRSMKQKGIPLVEDTFACCLKACGLVGAVEIGQDLHSELIERGLERELFVCTTLLDMYAKCGLLAEAQKTLSTLSVQGPATWNVLIAGYTEHQFGEEALKTFEQMQLQGISPVADTFACSFKACGMIGALEKGQQIHSEIIKRGLEKDIFVGSTMVDLYAKRGSVTEAKEVFDKLPGRDVATWNAMIKAYGENYQGDRAIQCFEEMQSQGMKPNVVTFTCLLTACSYASLVEKGQEYFRCMREMYHIEPRLEHFTCMIDLLARSGLIREAEKLAEGIKCFPPKEVLRSLLTACKVHGNVELGLKCFQQLVQVNQEDGAAYLLMADVYANAGRCSDSKRIEEVRIFAEAKKKLGSAFIEVNKEFYEFVVGDMESKFVSGILNMLSSQLKNEGYMPLLDAV